MSNKPSSFFFRKMDASDPTKVTGSAAGGDGIVAFNPALEEALRKLLPTQDPLDRPDFNPVEYINKRFPNEQSLSNVQDVLGKLKAKVRAIDSEIYDAVRRQASAGTRGTQDLSAAKLSLRELVSKVHEIKSKAEQSEVMVKEICRDIQSLDNAKKNLTKTITTLQQLKVLVTGVEDLKQYVEEKNYRDTAGLLQAMNDFSKHFQNHRSVPKIKEIHETLAKIEIDVRTYIYEDFENYIRNEGGVSDQKDLYNACLVIDAMGTKARDEFVAWYSNKMIHPYKSQFLKSSDISNVENIERRFSWLQTFLQTYEEKYMEVFPYYWQMEEIVCTAFCQRTKDDLSDILSNYRNVEAVSVVIKGLQKTLDFETKLVKRFSDESLIPQTSEADQPQSAVERIREKYRSDSTSSNKTAAPRIAGGKLIPEDHDHTAHPLKLYSFDKVISIAFESHMTLYIQMEERDLHGLIQSINAEDWSAQGGEGEGGKQNEIFANCNKLFIHFKKIMTRCSKFSKGQTFYDLFKLMKRFIKIYCDTMLSKLPSGKVAAPTGGLMNPINPFGNAGSQQQVPEWYIRLSDGDLQFVCLTINTSEYCLDLVGSLGEGVLRTIDAGFKEQIDLTPESEEFHNAISKAIQVLVTGLETRLDPSLINMTKMNWGTLEVVADQSEYVTTMISNMSSYVATVRNTVSLVYFKFFCDKFAASFIPKYIQNIYKCKRINETGAQQLLVDLIGLKGALLDIHNAGHALVTQAPPASYTKVCQKELGKGEAILKVVMSTNESIADNYRSLVPDGHDGDFQKILELRGFKRQEQQSILQRYTELEGPKSFRTLFK